MAEFVEVYEGIDIAQGTYRAEALQIAADARLVDDALWQERGYKGFYGLIPPKGVELNASVGDEAKARAQKIHTELGALAYDLTGYENRTTVNKYDRKKSGPWHDDYPPLLPVYVLGLVDIKKPSFEYAPHAAPSKEIKRPDGPVFSVALQAGDVLRVSNSIVHRGVNPTRDNRYTGVMYRFG